MRTPEEWIIQKKLSKIDPRWTIDGDDHYDLSDYFEYPNKEVSDMIREIQAEAYNQAIEDVNEMLTKWAADHKDQPQIGGIMLLVAKCNLVLIK